MREPEDPRLDPQDAALPCLSQSLSCNIRPDGGLDHAHGRLGEGRGMQDDVRRGRRKRPDPIPDQLRQAVRQRQVALIRRLASTLHRARDLDGIERVSARGPVQPLERARWQLHLEHVAEEPLELREQRGRERSRARACRAPWRGPPVAGLVADASTVRSAAINRIGSVLEAAERELEYPGRRPVHPRDVVDRQQERAAFRSPPEAMPGPQARPRGARRRRPHSP